MGKMLFYSSYKVYVILILKIDKDHKEKEIYWSDLVVNITLKILNYYISYLSSPEWAKACNGSSCRYKDNLMSGICKFNSPHLFLPFICVCVCFNLLNTLLSSLVLGTVLSGLYIYSFKHPTVSGRRSYFCFHFSSKDSNLSNGEVIFTRLCVWSVVKSGEELWSLCSEPVSHINIQHSRWKKKDLHLQYRLTLIL